jgi:hypothetical protein
VTKNPILIAAVAFILAGFGFNHYALSPKKAEANKAKAQVTEAQSRLDAARALLATNQAARASYRADYSTVVRLGKAVPSDDDVRSLVVQLDSAAKATHVDFDSIEVSTASGTSASSTSTGSASGASLPPGATIGPAGFPIMPFTFTFTGQFFRLGAFFQKLDAFVHQSNDKLSVNGRLLTVEGIKLEPDSTGFPNIKATVQATSYLASPLEGSTGGATAAGPAGTTAGTSTVPTTTAMTTGAIR